MTKPPCPYDRRTQEGRVWMKGYDAGRSSAQNRARDYGVYRATYESGYAAGVAARQAREASSA